LAALVGDERTPQDFMRNIHVRNVTAHLDHLMIRALRETSALTSVWPLPYELTLISNPKRELAERWVGGLADDLTWIGERTECASLRALLKQIREAVEQLRITWDSDGERQV
jgi:hypothetical protein